MQRMMVRQHMAQQRQMSRSPASLRVKIVWSGSTLAQQAQSVQATGDGVGVRHKCHRQLAA